MSNTTNTVVAAAILAINTDKQKQVESEAGLLVGYILNEQATIKRLEGEIKSHQEELAKVSHDLIDVASVTGAPAPRTPNISESTVAKVIAKLNEDKQKSVEVVAQRLGEAITQKQASIKATNERITELRAKLVKLQAQVVTPETVLS